MKNSSDTSPRRSGAPHDRRGPAGSRPGGRPPGHSGRTPKTRRIRPNADGRLKKIFDEIGTPEPTPFIPDPFQLEALEVILHADCLVTAPTGAGKTWIAEQAIARIRETGGRAWYASPLKALTNSKYIEFSASFGTENVGILTGDRKDNPDAQVIVGTTEILRNQLYDAMHEGRDLGTDFVILDEAHYLGDMERGVVWEEVMIYLPPRIPILMLSATIGNADEIASWLAAIRQRPCRVVTETKRPVPLYPLYLHPSGTLYPLLAGGEAKSRLFPKVLAHETGENPVQFNRPGQLPPFGDILRVLRRFDLLPAIFFLKSRSDCDGALEKCEDNPAPDEERRRRIREIIGKALEMTPHLADHRQIRALEDLGVGSHHSGQLPAWKLLVESLLTEGLLDAVFATSTVAAGVNFPARTILMLNSDRFNGVEFLPLTSTEFHQMTGRAGRRGMDRIGFATVVPGKFMDAKLIGRLVNARPGDVASQIRVNFSMTLNLLLSHAPNEIQLLLERSFAAYLIAKHPKKAGHAPEAGAGPSALAQDFSRHFDFLVETGFANSEGRLTEDGIWASRLRVDQPLLIAEGFRSGFFPQDDPRMLAAIIAAFVNERESSDRFTRDVVPNPLNKAFHRVTKGLAPFQERMIEEGFFTRPFYLRPALAVFLWASALWPWEKVVTVAELAEGDMAMLLLRTADNLRHIVALRDVFPQAAESASQAIDLLIREPVSAFYG